MSGMLARYQALVAAGELRADAGQRKAAEALDRLQGRLERSEETGLFAKLFARKREAPRGLY
ncbi:MAG: cell division protein ZapE, partial [Alphaproteobacteria bacterium]